MTSFAPYLGSRPVVRRPETLPATRFGQLPGQRVSYTQAEPALVVEFEHDAAWERGRFRHATTFVRLRAELRPRTYRAGHRLLVEPSWL